MKSSGNAFTKLDLGPIEKAFDPGELPELFPGPVGRFRLVSNLQRKYGENFRMVQAAREALDHFDKETDMIAGFLHLKEQIDGERR